MEILPSAREARAPGSGRRKRLWLAFGAVAALALAWLGCRGMESLAIGRLRAFAAARGSSVRWQKLEVGPFGGVTVLGLRVEKMASHEEVLTAERVRVDLDWLSVLLGHPRPSRVRLDNSRIVQPRPAAEDSLAEIEGDSETEESAPEGTPPMARSLTFALHLITRDFARLPRVELANVTLIPRANVDSVVVRTLAFDPRSRSKPLEADGAWFAPVPVPFSATSAHVKGRGLGMSLRSDPGIRGDQCPFGLLKASVLLTPAGPPGRWRVEALVDSLVMRGQALSTRQVAGLDIHVDGGLSIERRPSRVTLADSTTIAVGRIPLRMGFDLDERGPVAALTVEAHGLDQPRLVRELPRAVLGPLADVNVHGMFDYTLNCRVDFAHLDQTTLEGDVVPHALWLDDLNARLPLTALNQQFTAEIHLPGSRIETRIVGPANPFFTPYVAIPPQVVYSILANEDGGFFQHRGFSQDAMRDALVTNLRRGRFVRGAGTITMQLVRNLWLGHERSLTRKAQEVALTWLIENLAEIPKERLLEIYLNIIEWAPGVHGIGEAARFYFDKDPRQLTLDEALFLTVVIPSPRLWRYRFERGTTDLRRSTRQQMLFIARAMARKGWIAPEQVPASAESLHVEPRGQARAILLPPPRDSVSVRS